MDFALSDEMGVAGGFDDGVVGCFGAGIGLEAFTDAIRADGNRDVLFRFFDSAVLFCTHGLRLYAH